MGMRRILPLLLALSALATSLTGTAAAQNRYFEKGETGLAVTAARESHRDDRHWAVGAGLSWNGRLAVIYHWHEMDPSWGDEISSLGVEVALIRAPFFILEAGYQRFWRDGKSGSLGGVPLRAAIPLRLGRTMVLTPHATLTSFSIDGDPYWDTDVGLDLRIAGLVLLAAELNTEEDPIDVGRAAVRAGLTLGF